MKKLFATLTALLFILCPLFMLSGEETGLETEDTAPSIAEITDTEGSYLEFAEKTSIPSRSEKQNSVTINVGSEALVIGVEYSRYLRMGGKWFPYMSINGGVGSWMEGNSLWGGIKTFYGEKNWAPYIGASAALWNGQIRDKETEDLASVKALGIYVPLGLQYFGKNGFVISYEAAAYSIASMSWNVKKDELEQPDTKFAFDSDRSWRDIEIWFALKIGFAF